MTNGNPLVSIVITTRNRPEDVLRAVASCMAQDYQPLEVVVYDDCSERDIAGLVQGAFPGVRVFRGQAPVGLIVLRNCGFREAAGKYVVSIDDDAYFTDHGIVRRTVELMEKDASIGSVAIPYIEPLERQALSSLQVKNHAKPMEELRSYVGCSHALKRELALELNGYREFFFQQGEERDLAIRIYAAGYRIVLGDSAPIVHEVSPNRDPRARRFGMRNTLLCDFLNMPLRLALPLMLIHAFKMARYRATWKTFPGNLGRAALALMACPAFWQHRTPAPAAIVRHWLKLRSHGPSLPEGGILPTPCGYTSQEQERLRSVMGSDR